MFAELNSILDWREGYLPKGNLIFIKDKLESEGAFLLHHFLFAHLKANKEACLVALEQSLFHYTSVAKKLVPNTLLLFVVYTYLVVQKIKASNLQGTHAKGKLIHFNCMSAPYTWASQSLPSATSKDAKTPATNIETHNFSLALERETPLKELYQQIASSLFGTTHAKDRSTDDSNSAFAIVLDSINPLLSLCPPLQVLDFIHYLHLLAVQKVIIRPSS